MTMPSMGFLVVEVEGLVAPMARVPKVAIKALLLEVAVVEVTVAVVPEAIPVP